MSHEQNTKFSSVECIVWLTTLSRRVLKLECRICHMHYFVKLNCWFLVLAVFVNVKSRASAKLRAFLFSREAWKLEGQLIIASMDVTPAFNSSFIFYCLSGRNPTGIFISVWILPEKQAFFKNLDLRHRRTWALRGDNYGRLTIYIWRGKYSRSFFSHF